MFACVLGPSFHLFSSSLPPSPIPLSSDFLPPERPRKNLCFFFSLEVSSLVFCNKGVVSRVFLRCLLVSSRRVSTRTVQRSSSAFSPTSFSWVAACNLFLTPHYFFCPPSYIPMLKGLPTSDFPSFFGVLSSSNPLFLFAFPVPPK